MRVECFNKPDKNADLDLYYCGYEDCDEDFYCGPNVRNNYLIHFVVKGIGYFKTRDKVYALHEGDYFIIFPNEVVYYWTDEKNPWSFCWFAFDGNKAPQYITKLGADIFNPIKHLKAQYNYNVKNEIDKMIELLEKEKSAYRTKTLGHLYLVLSILEQENAPQARVIQPEYIDKALAFIEYNYQKRISVKDIVEYVQLDRSYFSKLFKSHLGVCPQEYLLKYRVDKAIELMQTTNLTLKVISKCVGIEEEYYFWRIFKKIMGVAPSEYYK